MLDNLWGTIKANFFYDLRSTIVSICVLIGAFFLYKSGARRRRSACHMRKRIFASFLLRGEMGSLTESVSRKSLFTLKTLFSSVKRTPHSKCR